MINTYAMLFVIAFFISLLLAFYVIRKCLGGYPRVSIKEIIYKKKFQKLRKAANWKNLDIQALQELQASGFNINEDDHRVLELACRKGNLPIVKLCVENGASIKAKEYALIYACMDGYLHIIQYLVESGINPRAFHDSILTYSASLGHLEIALYLVSKGCDPHNILNPNQDRGFCVSDRSNDRAKEWAEKYINAQEMAEKLDGDLQPKTTTNTGRIKI